MQCIPHPYRLPPPLNPSKCPNPMAMSPPPHTMPFPPIISPMAVGRLERARPQLASAPDHLTPSHRCPIPSQRAYYQLVTVIMYSHNSVRPLSMPTPDSPPLFRRQHFFNLTRPDQTRPGHARPFLFPCPSCPLAVGSLPHSPTLFRLASDTTNLSSTIRRCSPLVLVRGRTE